MSGSPREAGPAGLCQTTASSFADNRAALARLKARLRFRGHPAARGGLWEMALAEALNNIAEHAYAGRSDGRVRIEAFWNETHLQVILEDEGLPMPRGLPRTTPGGLTALDPAALPEGGFGWGLIRAAADRCFYRRASGRNHLFLLLPFDPG